MNSRQIIFTILFAILFAVLGLIGVVQYWQSGQARPLFPEASLFSFAEDFSLSEDPQAIQPHLDIPAIDTQTQTAQENGRTPANISGEGDREISNIDIAPEQLVAGTSISSWEEFFAAYHPGPVTLPSATLLASPDSLYLRAVQSPDLYPLRNWEVPFRDIDGKAVLAIEAPEKKMLYQKNIFEPLPIASISKLMTALVAAETLALEEPVVVSKAAVETPHEAGGLVVGETLTVHQLLYTLLLESSNDAAVALEEAFDLRRTEKDQTFVVVMNKRAQELGLASAFFEEPTGLSEKNVASAHDVASMMFAAYEHYTLRTIMGTSVYETKSKEDFAHRWVNSNSLLGAMPGIVAGKTGYTEEAGECMALVTKRSDEEVVITVVLGSTNRVQAMSDLLGWLKEGYIWSD